MKTKLITLSFLLLFSTNTFAQDTGLTNYVDPLIGSEGLGRVFIGPSCPYGNGETLTGLYPTSQQRLVAMPEQVDGFSQVHVSGTGGGPKYGNILVMPFCNGMDLPQSHRPSQGRNNKIRILLHPIPVFRHTNRNYHRPQSIVLSVHLPQRLPEITGHRCRILLR